MDHATASEPRGDRFARAAWILLDWAASGFSTVFITLVVAYVEKIVFPDGGFGVAAGVVWSWTLAAAMLASAGLLPWAAAWADRHDGHQRALVCGTIVGVGGLVALGAMPPTARPAVLAATIAACIGFDIAQAFTGSLLARIAGGRDADRLSACGFAAGYAGGAIALCIATTIVASHDRLGVDVPGGLRWAFVATAAWWLGFSMPAALVRFRHDATVGHASSTGRDMLAFARSLMADGTTGSPFAAVLAGSMLVLGGVQTAIAQFSSLAIQRFDLDGPALVRLVLLVQAVALPGALATGWLSVRCGRRFAAAVCLAGWTAVLVLSWFVSTQGQLIWLAALLALVLGGVQSLLRAAVAVLTPPGRSGVTFGLMQVGTKLAGFVASLFFGAMQVATSEPKAGLLTLIAQMLAGWWLLRRLP